MDKRDLTLTLRKNSQMNDSQVGAMCFQRIFDNIWRHFLVVTTGGG